MPTFISFVNWTDQGVKNVKDSPNRAEAAKALAKQMGGEIKQLYFTSGEYDLVAVAEFPDGDAMTKFVLTIGAQGNIRTSTTRAWTEEDFQKIVSQMS